MTRCGYGRGEHAAVREALIARGISGRGRGSAARHRLVKEPGSRGGGPLEPQTVTP